MPLWLLRKWNAYWNDFYLVIAFARNLVLFMYAFHSSHTHAHSLCICTMAISFPFEHFECISFYCSLQIILCSFTFRIKFVRCFAALSLACKITSCFVFVMALTQSYFLKMKLKIESNFRLNRHKKHTQCWDKFEEKTTFNRKKHNRVEEKVTQNE